MFHKFLQTSLIWLTKGTKNQRRAESRDSGNNSILWQFLHFSSKIWCFWIISHITLQKALENSPLGVQSSKWHQKGSTKHLIARKDKNMKKEAFISSDTQKDLIVQRKHNQKIQIYYNSVWAYLQF